MTVPEEELPHWLIQPEPTPEELVALLAVLQTNSSSGRLDAEDSQSQWAQIARYEQMRVPLDAVKSGWSR